MKNKDQIMRIYFEKLTKGGLPVVFGTKKNLVPTAEGTIS